MTKGNPIGRKGRSGEYGFLEWRGRYNGTAPHVFQGFAHGALFLSLALGYRIGKLKVGNFQLGGMAGTLLVAIVIGQVDVTVDPVVKRADGRDLQENFAVKEKRSAVPNRSHCLARY